MTAFKIDDDVPIPSRGRGAAKDPNSLSGAIRRLEAGQSVFAGTKDVSSVSSTCSVLKRRHPEIRDREFTSRTVTENGVKGVRVWRIA